MVPYPFTPDKTVVVSGIQSSGALHLGNYFGALRQHISLHKRYPSYYFIVNYHAMTTVRDPDALWAHTLDAAVTYLALGFDPTRGNLFVQSDVPLLNELTWIFFCLTPVSQLEKATSYKDKIAQGLTANCGLFNYPILQASDILIYGGTLVPVGADQKQHIEIARDTAQRFNRTWSPDQPLFPIPDAHIMKNVAIVPGIDGRKMSKSYDNTIGIFEEGKALTSRIKRIVTDSTPLEDPKDPDQDNVFALIRLFASEEQQAEIREAYQRGGYGYGHAKSVLTRLITEYFAPAREKRRELLKDPDYVRDVLRQGGINARERAEACMNKVRELTGLMTTYRV
ncbi:MAG: tryptophan--tRNA ligase [Rhodothermaceae bacterium]|nr:tryptophan--tRNA ligase [Rhodothermaceae bacterium]MYG69468.1 tryptophan--tRNA ligase [Rhodothermaceae bacterium]MYJ44553.1 tryptophan--tRNA ligase [Rhodothermaceae bacterium]